MKAHSALTAITSASGKEMLHSNHEECHHRYPDVQPARSTTQRCYGHSTLKLLEPHHQCR
jgi:hypothetical protein